MSISENIKALREKYNLTQAELGEIAGVSDKAVSTWENGTAEPRMGAIQKIAEHFGITKASLVAEENEYYTNPEVAKLAEEMSSKPGLRVLFDASRDLSEESLKMFAQMIDTFKKTNPEG